MAFKEHGRIFQLSEIRSGVSKSGNNWQNQTIVLDVTYGTYSKKFALNVSGSELEDVNRYRVGDDVEVEFFIGSREWQGKWYTSAELVGIHPQGPAPQRAQAPQQAQAQDNDWGGDGSDDLPFGN